MVLQLPRPFTMAVAVTLAVGSRSTILKVHKEVAPEQEAALKTMGREILAILRVLSCY